MIALIFDVVVLNSYLMLGGYGFWNHASVESIFKWDVIIKIDIGQIKFNAQKRAASRIDLGDAGANKGEIFFPT